MAYYAGQITNYMDDCKCRYSFASTYGQTIVIKCVGSLRFQLSQVIRHSTVSGTYLEAQARTACLLYGHLQVYIYGFLSTYEGTILLK